MEKNQQGISLMEVLISLVIMSIGLLAILKMQIYAMQAANSALTTSIAIIRLDSLRSIYALGPSNFSELFANWATENNLYLPETRVEQQDKKIDLLWYDSFRNNTFKIQAQLN